ncbi:MAG TPA: hypothetical protein VL461_06205 [Dictyobacter sp.]|nr:hypothetical protein [Dictyobacter sp.]
MPDRQEMMKKPVVFTLPGMEQVQVERDRVYKTVDELALKMDVYYPPAVSPQKKYPAVLFVHGEAWAATDDEHDVKDAGQYTCWGQLVAASGCIGVTFNHRVSRSYTRLHEAGSDIDDFINYVRTQVPGVDPERLCLFVVSGGGPYGLCAGLRSAAVRCCVVYYAMLNPELYRAFVDPSVSDEDLTAFSPVAYLRQMTATDHVAPLFIVRAGQDHPDLKETIDQFVTEALAHDVDFELINYVQGHHAFDVLDDTEQSRHIIRQTLVFIQRYIV